MSNQPESGNPQPQTQSDGTDGSDLPALARPVQRPAPLQDEPLDPEGLARLEQDGGVEPVEGGDEGSPRAGGRSGRAGGGARAWTSFAHARWPKVYGTS